MGYSTEELEQLRGFSLAVLDYFGLALSKESLEPIRITESLRGLREAARDMVEMCEDLAADPHRRARSSTSTPPADRRVQSAAAGAIMRHRGYPGRDDGLIP